MLLISILPGLFVRFYRSLTVSVILNQMVLKVPMVCKKCKSCVLTIVSKVKGLYILSMALIRSSL